MNPPLLSFWTLVLVVVALASTACSTIRERRNPPVAIAVRLVGDAIPSAHQVNHIRQVLQSELLRKGFTLAEDPGVAEYVLTVSFIPAPDGEGGRVSIASFEPARRFRDATDAGDTPEAKEWRRRLREIEGWAQLQGSGRDS
jgi:hypothetical protein